MEQYSIFGKFSFLVIPIAIALVWVLGPSLNALMLGVILGAIISNFRAVLFIGKILDMEKNPLLKLQAEANGVNLNTKFKFIFIKTISGGFVFGLYTGIILGIALLFH